MRDLDRAIIICAMGRSGSNILWNAIASSPDVKIAHREFHEFHRASGRAILRRAKHISENVSELLAYRLLSVDTLRRDLTHSLESAKASDTQLLERRGIDAHSQHVACFKVMATDRIYLSAMRRSFRDAKILFLVKNGLSVCESFARRGFSARRVGRSYAAFARYAISHVASNPSRYRIIRFEDLLTDACESLQGLYKWGGIEFPSDGRILYKDKGYGCGQEYSSRRRHEKVLVPIEEISSLLDASAVSDAERRLTSPQRRRFLSQAESVMLQLGYLDHCVSQSFSNEAGGMAR